MAPSRPDFFSADQVPDFDDTITTATPESFQRVWIFGHGIDTVYMTRAHLPDEWGCEHALHFDGIESPGVLSGSLERVL